MKTTKRLTEHILEVGRKGPFFYVNDVSKYAYGYFLYFFFLWKHCVSFLPQTCPSADKVPDLDRGGPTLFSAKEKKEEKYKYSR